MRLARRHTAVVIRADALPARASLNGRVAFFMASGGISPRLGEAQGELVGDGISSGMSRLGDTGRK